MAKEKTVRLGQQGLGQQGLSQPKTKPKEQKSDELIIVVGDRLMKKNSEAMKKLKKKHEAVEAMGGYKDGGRTKLKGGGMSQRGLGRAFKNGGRS